MRARPSRSSAVPPTATQLNKLRDEVLKPAGNWSTFYWPGFGHTILLSEHTVYNVPVNGTTAAQWASQIRQTPPTHVPN